MVMYYGHHYMAMCLSASLGCWLLFDDKRVTRVGNWGDVTLRCVDVCACSSVAVVYNVARRCVKGRLQPTMLIYESMHVRECLPSRRHAAALTHVFACGSAKAVSGTAAGVSSSHSPSITHRGSSRASAFARVRNPTCRRRGGPTGAASSVSRRDTCPAARAANHCWRRCAARATSEARAACSTRIP